MDAAALKRLRVSCVDGGMKPVLVDQPAGAEVLHHANSRGVTTMTPQPRRPASTRRGGEATGGRYTTTN